MLHPFAFRGRTGVLAAVLLAIILSLSLRPQGSVGAPSKSSVERQIERDRGRESQLRTTAQRLAALERTATAAVDAAQARLADTQSQFDAAQTRLNATSGDLRATRARVVRLRQRLTVGRRALAASLRARYTAEPPGVVEVVLSADGFSDLLEQVDFLKRIQARDTDLVQAVRSAQSETVRDERRLARVRATQKREAETLTRQRNAMAEMTAGLEQRRSTVAAAHRARQAALSSAQSRRRSAERTLTRLEAAQARAVKQYTSRPSGRETVRTAGGSSGGGSGGPWAIPWAIVQCESGGQNTGPNSMGASGYYQFIPQTWKALGGSTPHAYQASKAEQDRLAARLWAGGSGARNWDCAAMVGITG